MASIAEQVETGELTVRVGSVRWTVCAMLFAATTINYMDRQVIAILKPTLEQSIGMSEVAYGYVVGAFQISYALGLLAAGRLVDKVGTRFGYAAIMALWSLSAMGHALANSAVAFGVARFSLGIGESGNFPAAIKAVAEWFPRGERSLAVGLFNSGAMVGAVLAPLAVPWVAIHLGWHAAFLTTGIFSVLWIVWWLPHYRRPQEHPKLGKAEREYILDGAVKEQEPSMPWTALLKYRQTWAFAMGKFLTDPIWWFYLFWLPSYFSTRFHLSLLHLGMPLILVYSASAIGSVSGGWLPALFRKFGWSPARARLSAMFCCACLVLPIVLVNYVQSQWQAIALLGLAAGAHCGWSANILSMPADMFPQSAVGSVTGIGGMAGSVGGMIFATVAGYILEWTHNYASLFVVAAYAYLVSFVLIFMLARGLGKVEFARQLRHQN